MKKFWIFWSLAALIVGAVILWGIQRGWVSTADKSRMEIQELANEQDAVEQIQSTLAADLRDTPIWLVGIFPDDGFAAGVFAEFVKDPAQEIKFDEIWLDEVWQGDLESYSDLELQKGVALRAVYLRRNESLVRDELNKQMQQGRRILILSTPIDVNSTLGGTPAALLAIDKDLKFKTLTFSTFPRLRSEEPQMKIPCVTSPSDQTGTGALGCAILNKSRRLYTKRFTPGNHVGLIEFMSDRDILFLNTVEPEVPTASHSY